MNARTQAAPDPARPGRILVADDRAVDRDYYATLLRYAGHEVQAAGDGAEALALARSWRPDLVLADVMMPTLDGYALLRAIRADPAIAATRAIFCTATYHEQEARQLAAAVGAAHFLTKPVEPQALLAAIAAALHEPLELAETLPPAEAERIHLRLLNEKLLAKTAELEAEVAARRRAEADLRDSQATLAQAEREHRDHLEALVAERTAELQRANQELQAFTYAASHDLKAPLGRINSFGTLLEMRCGDRLDGECLAFLTFIRQNAARMSTLVDALLAHAHVGRGEGLQAVEVGALARAVVAERSEDIREAGAELRLDLPEAAVRADPQGLAQALRNLLENALKYAARAEPPRIEIGGEASGGHFRLWVRDNGIGFDMAYHDRIFEIFRRLHTYDEIPGSGVGLALVNKAMQQMGGRVWAESAPGQGATFYLELPLGRDGSTGKPAAAG